MASPSVASPLASRLGISTPKRSSQDITISITSRLSAPRSFEPGAVRQLRSVDAEMKREDFPDLRTDVTHRNAPKLSPPQGPSFPYTLVGVREV